MSPTELEYWKRLGTAADRADRERLRALTLEEGLRRFEELCREMDGQFQTPPLPRTHAVGLSRFWKMP